MSQVNLSKMINIVFSTEPAQPKSYKLDLSVDTDDTVDIESEEFKKELAKTTSNVLMNILISGCQILFEEDISPQNISKSQFSLINKYINSFGYETHYEYEYKETHNHLGEIVKIPCNLNVHFTELE
jgi:hypothetical protein